MFEATTHPLEFYARPGPMTDLGDHIELMEGLPTEISALCEIVQGNLLHIYWAERYGVELSEARKGEVEIRSAGEMLAHIRAVDDRPLTTPRSLEKRLVGNCRDFSTLLCSLLRHLGIPARARCGFGAYFEPVKNEDHWVCEYWRADEERWVQADAQLDDFQRRALQINFDPHDVPHDQFLSAGRAWQLCRAGQADPNHFGILDMWGLWFIRGNLVRDLAALNKMELLPWDCWGFMDKDEDAFTPDDMALLDRVAALTLEGNEAFAEVRATYENEERLRVPAVIRSYTAAGVQAVDIRSMGVD
jgi:hypothetical protein